MWGPNTQIYFSLGCTTFVSCFYVQLCPVVVWEDGGSSCISDSLSVVDQALGSCPSQLRSHMNPTQAFSSSALGGWVCGVGPYAIGSA